MCGIFCFFGDNSIHNNDLLNEFNKLSGRGPDNKEFKIIYNDIEKNNKIIFGFHRLKINDMTDLGNQPMYLDDNSLICNGEIFNYEDIKFKNNYNTKSKSDCEIILFEYKRYGMLNMIKNLDAEFAFILYDKSQDIIYAGRDAFGVRPLFKGSDKKGNIYFSSEIKSISNLCETIERFPPGCYWDSKTMNYTRYYYYIYPILKIDENEDSICENIKQLLIKAVDKRLMSDRPIGCLLSGGLDSSLICSITNKLFKEKNKGVLNTFSIGMPGSTDLKFATLVANHLGTNHHNIEVSSDDFLKAIPEVIYSIESYDTTTVRASVGNYLIGKYIKENTDLTVIYNGDGSDEQSGYLYLKNAPNEDEFQNECIDLLKNIHMFDCLRSDRSISSKWSLESRTPFLDKDFVEYYMSIEPKKKMYSNTKIEKYLLRKAFEKDNYLPNEVLWRKKEAFSDGCSSPENSWNKIIQTYVNTIISDEEFEKQKNNFTHNQPQMKESLYYRIIFEKYYSKHSNIIDFFWMPKWCGKQIDPSARELDIYNN
jgi:asparagine synthase (glutamine-hydrolysing)